MYVCICKSITDQDIRDAARSGVRDVEQLQRETGCSTGCGCCAELAGALLSEAVREQSGFLPLAASSAAS